MYHSRYFIGSGLCGSSGLFGGLWGWFIAVGFIILIATVIFLLISKRRHPASSSGALGELDRKFALGEITEEEYLRRKSILKGKKV